MLHWIKAHTDWYKNAGCIVTLHWRYVLSIFWPAWCMGVLSHCSHSKITSQHPSMLCPKLNKEVVTTSMPLIFLSNHNLLSFRFHNCFFFPSDYSCVLPIQNSASSFSSRTTARLAILIFCRLQLVSQLVCKLSHDVMDPDVPFFLWSVDQEHRQFPVPGISGFLYGL